MTKNNKNAIAATLGSMAAKYGTRIQTCATNGDYSRYDIHGSGCATLGILGNANGCEFKHLHRNSVLRFPTDRRSRHKKRHTENSRAAVKTMKIGIPLQKNGKRTKRSIHSD